MKRGMDRYAKQNRIKQKGYLRKESSERTTGNSCYCYYCQKAQEKKEKQSQDQCQGIQHKPSQRDFMAMQDVPGHQSDSPGQTESSEISNEELSQQIDREFRSFGGLLNQKSKEEIKELINESKTRIGSEIQSSGEERSEVGSIKPRSRRSRSRQSKVRREENGINGESGQS